MSVKKVVVKKEILVRAIHALVIFQHKKSPAFRAGLLNLSLIRLDKISIPPYGWP